MSSRHMASRRARYTLHQVLKHILEEGSESENETSETSEDEEEGAVRFIHSDVPNTGPEQNHRRLPELQVLVRLAL